MIDIAEKKKRSLLSRVWQTLSKKKKEDSTQSKQSYTTVSTQNNTLLLGEDIDVYRNRLVRRIVNKYGDLIASTPLKYYRRDASGVIIEEHSKVLYMLNNRPNKMMNGFDLKKQFIARALLYNNSYIWIKKNNLGEIEEFIPILSNNIRLITPKDYPEYLYLDVILPTGVRRVIPYEEVLHLRGDFVENTFFGDDTKPLAVVVDINDTLWKNLVQWANNNSFLKGFLQTESVLNDEDMLEARNNFKKILQETSSGIEVLDGKFDYKAINGSNVSMDSSSVQKCEEEIFDYFGMNRKILNGTATPQEIESFHKLELQPKFTAIEQELNRKLTTQKENASWDRKFEFKCSSFEHMQPTEKKDAFTLLSNIGGITINEIREGYGLSRVEGGDVLMYSKNFAAVGATKETSKIDSNKDKETDVKKEEPEVEEKGKEEGNGQE